MYAVLSAVDGEEGEGRVWAKLFVLDEGEEGEGEVDVLV